MENSKTKRTLIVTICLSLLAIILSIVQFVILDERKPQLMTYYVANQEVAPYTQLDESMFRQQTYMGDELPTGLVSDVQQVVGKYSSTVLSKGDLLTIERVTEDTLEANQPYTMEIQASYMGDIVYGDTVEVYYFRGNETPAVLFKNKKVYADKSLGAAPIGQKVTQMYIRVTDTEMKDYYKKLSDYAFIIVPIDKAFVGQNSQNLFPPDLESEKENPNNDPIIMINGKEIIMDNEWLLLNTEPYTPKEEDTKETIAEDFGTTVEILDQLNQFKELKIDEIYLVPVLNTAQE